MAKNTEKPAEADVLDASAASETETAASPEITIGLKEAEALYQMLRNVELAESHFHSCQATNFRQHVQETFHAAEVAAAYDALKAAIQKAKEG